MAREQNDGERRAALLAGYANSLPTIGPAELPDGKVFRRPGHLLPPSPTPQGVQNVFDFERLRLVVATRSRRARSSTPAPLHESR